MTLFVALLAKRITCAQLHYFHKMQNAMLILNQDIQERIAQDSLLRQIFLFRLLFLLLSSSLALLSWSLALFHLCLYSSLFLFSHSHSLAQSDSLLSLSLFLSHPLTHSIYPHNIMCISFSLFLSLSVSFCLFLPFFSILTLPPRNPGPLNNSLCAQLAHNKN